MEAAIERYYIAEILLDIRNVRINKRRPKKHPKQATDILKKWCDYQFQLPNGSWYPTKQDFIRLQRKTGLTSIQINNWFSNKRRRDSRFKRIACRRRRKNVT